ncbi:MAG: TonB family protein [Ignavibacteria bacterium]|nr:TonB family protein [Ignavibacteria bacterium]
MKNRLILTLAIFCLFISSTLAQSGIMKSFYPDGVPRSEISYVNDILDGLALFYYPNGNLKSEKNYSKGKLNGFVREYFDNGLLKEEYFLRDGVKDGSYRGYYDNGALKELVIFEKGIQVKKDSFKYDPAYAAPIEAYQAGNRQQQVFNKRKTILICDVEICPVPVGGLNSIQENLVYPEHALLYGLEGTVTLIATINEKGEVIASEIVKGIGLGCDEAAQDAVKKTQFIPGQNFGKVVESKVTLNIEFKIFDRSLIQSNNVNNGNQLQETKSKNEQKIISKPVNVLSIKCEEQVCPRPIGGVDVIIENFEIPQVAKRLKVKGEIIIEALVDKFGIVRDTKVIKGVGYGCEESLESAIFKTKFVSAKNGGVDVDSKITVNYTLSLD